MKTKRNNLNNPIKLIKEIEINERRKETKMKKGKFKETTQKERETRKNEKNHRKEKLEVEEILFSKGNNKQKENREGGNQKMKSKQERGITLIALVIMIIILLILAGVTLKAVLGENGLIQRTKQAVDVYQTESQREYLQQLILGMQLDNYSGNSTDDEELKKLGAKLYKRSLKHSTDWHIVKVGEEDYNDEKGDWYFVKKGTDLEGYGRASSSMLVNYETGEIRDLEEGEYLELLAGDMLAVTDSLIINVDSTLADAGTEQSKENLEAQFGKGVTLHNFDFESDNHEESGLTSKSFNFDGKDDYITVQYNDAEEKQKLLDRGITFEFYGKWNGGTSYDADKKVANFPYKGLFCYWNGIETEQALVRFGISYTESSRSLYWNAGWGIDRSDFSQEGSVYNINYNITNHFQKNSDIYMTITVDASNPYKGNGQPFKDNIGNLLDTSFGTKSGDYLSQKVYVNGNLIYEGDYSQQQWKGLEQYIKDLNTFCIGRSSNNGSGYWHYSNMNAYALRLYSRGLTPTEVTQNYEKSVVYHSETTQPN